MAQEKQELKDYRLRSLQFLNELRQLLRHPNPEWDAVEAQAEMLWEYVWDAKEKAKTNER